MQQGIERGEWIRNGGVEDSADDPVKTHGVKRQSILFALPYWKDLPVRNLVDVMHVEKNIAENLLKTLFGEKDNAAVRLDMQRRNIRRHLWLRRVRDQEQRAYIPDAPYVLTKVQRERFLECLKKLKLPSHYSSTLHSKITKCKLSCLKSHDFHVLLQDVMPLCMRNSGCEHMTPVIVRVSRLFKKICSKTVDIAERESLFLECAETLCLLEKELPPSFFDIMVHLCIHLVEELFLCGPVHVRWMYPFERYYKTLKGYVRNHAKPEGCMAKGFEIDEACGFASEYLGEGQASIKRVWDSEEDPIMSDLVLEGKAKPRKLDATLVEHIHAFVLDNVDCVEPFRQQYQAVVEERIAARSRWRNRHPGREGQRAPNFPPELSEITSFGEWLRAAVTEEIAQGREVDSTVRKLSQFPSNSAKKYRSANSYGYHFRVRSAEIGLRTSDSGIAATFVRECRYRIRDPNLVFAPIEYVGHLDEILELDYSGMHQVVFIGTWVQANYRGSNATVKKDRWGFTLANFTKMIPFGQDSFAFPSQCQQVFFCDSRFEPSWKVVTRTEPRGRRVVANGDDIIEGDMFRHGRDSDFTGLAVTNSLTEEALPPQINNGRVIRVSDLPEVDETEDSDTADHDLGMSSEED